LSSIHVQIPDEIARQLGKSSDDLTRCALRGLAAEGYRFGALTAAQVQQLLGLKSRWEADAFLKTHQCFLEYTEDDLSGDITAIRRSGGQ